MLGPAVGDWFVAGVVLMSAGQVRRPDWARNSHGAARPATKLRKWPDFRPDARSEWAVSRCCREGARGRIRPPGEDAYCPRL